MAKAEKTTADLLKEFASIDQEKLHGLSQDYLKLEENTTYNLVFTEHTTFSGEGGKETPAVILVDEDESVYINGNTLLVNALKKAKNIPCLVRIVTGKREKGNNSNNEYLKMDVFVLDKTVKKP